MPIPDLAHSQKERLAYIDFSLYFLGSLRRSDIVARFGIKEAAATRDIALYREIAEANIQYDTKAKIYRLKKSFNPLFSYTPEQVLTALSNGNGVVEARSGKPIFPIESPSQLSKPDLDVLSVITRAIHSKKVISIQYRSLSSGFTERQVIPYCLVDNGLRWHIRAYDRRRGRFTDFVVTRITNPKILEAEVPAENEDIALDIQWNRIVELEIKAHPSLSHKEVIEADYGMNDGLLKINLRAAVAGYLLRRWNIDCSPTGSLTGPEYHLWLSNREALYGVDNLVIAPGYQDD